MDFGDEILNLIKPLVKNTQVYLVGGYLRNFFLNGEVSSDRDLVCVGNGYNLAKSIAQELGGTFVELDSENKIYRVVLEDKKNYFDITQATDIKLDSKRRDFTINSIYYDINNDEIIDYCSGVNDIKNKLLRTYNLNNFTDDPLRLLRLYRFASYTGFNIDSELYQYTKENFRLLKNVAQERINYEIIKMFEGKYIVQTLLKMYEQGVLELVFPFVADIKRIPSNSHHHLDLIHHSIETVNNIRVNNPLLKIAAFYHDIGKPSTWTIEPQGRHRFIGHDIKGAEIAKTELAQLKFSKKQISYIAKMIKYHIYPATLVHCEDSKKAFARFVRKLGDDVPDIIELSRADRLSAQGEALTKDMIDCALNHLNNLLNYYNEVKFLVQDPKTLLDGKEIMEILNIKPSKEVGILLEKLKEAQLTGIVTTKEEAINYIKQSP